MSQKKVLSYGAALKKYAASNKKPSPIFKDLGERQSGNQTVCSVECSFADKVALGTGKTRIEAREAACKNILDALGIGKPKSLTTTAPKNSQKKNVKSKTNVKEQPTKKTENKNLPQEVTVKRDQQPKISDNELSNPKAEAQKKKTNPKRTNRPKKAFKVKK